MKGIRGKLYRVRIPEWARPYYGGKKRFAKRHTDHASGTKWVRERQLEIASRKTGSERGYPDLPPPNEIVFREAAAHWLAEADIEHHTRICYKSILNANLLGSFRDTPVSQIGRSAILSHWERRKEAEASADSRKRDLVVLRMVLAWARDNGYAVDASAWAVKRPKTKPTITRRFDPALLDQFLGSLDPSKPIAIPDDPKRKKRAPRIEKIRKTELSVADVRELRALLEIDCLTGLRRGELAAMRVEWIRWHEGSIQLPHDLEFSPKGKRGRRIPLTARLRAVLKEWLGDRDEGLVFPPLREYGGRGPARYRDLRLVVRRLKAVIPDAGITGWHDLRHWWASRLINLGAKLPEVMEIAGWKDLATAQRYIHASPDYLASTRDLTDRADRTRARQRVSGQKRERAPVARKPARGAG